MSPGTIIRINFLILALFLVIVFMSNVQDGALKRGFETMFGVPQTTSQPASR